MHGNLPVPVDKPEEAMPSNEFATGGQVEHEVIMIGGILFFVIQEKSDLPSCNNLAQLFLEFLSSARMNEKADFEGLHVYGILTNLTLFAFYSYDPISNTFFRDNEILVSPLRDDFLSGMIHVTNKIFGLVLIAFIEGLRAIVKKSKQRAARGDLSSVGSSARRTLPPPKPDALEQSVKGKQMQKSIEGWELALRNAEDCRLKFTEKVTTIEDMEIRSTEALEILTKSVCSIPRFSAYTTRQSNNCLTTAELKDLACKSVESTLRESLT